MSKPDRESKPFLTDAQIRLNAILQRYLWRIENGKRTCCGVDEGEDHTSICRNRPLEVRKANTRWL
jgi:hypothetical protein